MKIVVELGRGTVIKNKEHWLQLKKDNPDVRLLVVNDKDDHSSVAPMFSTYKHLPVDQFVDSVATLKIL